MNFIRRLFRSSKSSLSPQQSPQLSEREQAIQAATNQLWLLLKEVMETYHSDGCACRYPRFHQYVQIDCTDTGKSFYMSETEGFIAMARPYFEIREMPPGTENYRNEYICKTCGSVYESGWSDFSIHVSRTYLKMIDKRVSDTGAKPIAPIPFVVGLFGHALPPLSDFLKVDILSMKKYLLEREMLA